LRILAAQAVSAGALSAQATLPGIELPGAEQHRLSHEACPFPDVGCPGALLEKHGFTFVQYLVLSWLRDGIALNSKDICFQFRHNSGALTRVIDQLAERGLLERIRRDRDRRKVDLQLTNDSVAERVDLNWELIWTLCLA
jgi:DNA-binding MarR family transcriptional regulator